MTDGLNKVQLIGNLGADPDLRMTQGGRAVLKLRLAASESYLDANKVRQTRTEWFDVDIWGRRAEALSRFLAKGARLYVEGRLQSSQYEDSAGVTRYRMTVVASNIILCGGGGSTSSNTRATGGGGGRPADDYSSGDYGDDDIPF